MNYQVFARKWRPKKFSEIVGQSHIVKAIIHSFNLNRIHHAYILAGTRGSGKTTIARLFAKGLNCKEKLKSDTDIICGKCKNCLDIELGCFIDLIEIDAASRSKVEETREFLDNIQYYPSQGFFKIYLIDEVHMLSRYSFNALLKTLEEPPDHVKFILVTTEHQKIPETILSRCLQFYFKPLNISHIVTQLRLVCSSEKIEADTDALELLAYAAKGSMRDALNFLEQVVVLGKCKINSKIVNDTIGMLNIERSLSLVENLVNGDINQVMHKIDYYSVLGINWDYFFDEVLTVFQKIAINQFTSVSLHKEININEIENIEKRIDNLSDSISPENVQLYYQIFLLGKKELPYAPSYRIGMEMTVLRALTFCPVNLKADNNFNNSVRTAKNVPVSHNTMQDQKIDLSSLKIDNMITNNVKSKNTDCSNIPKIKNLQIKDSTTIMNINQKDQIYTDRTENTLQNITKVPKIGIKSDDIDSNITSEILNARSKLINYHKDYNQLIESQSKSQSSAISKELLENILKRFSNINLESEPNTTCNIKKK